MKHRSSIGLVCSVFVMLGAWPAVLLAAEDMEKSEVKRELSEAVDAIKRFSVSHKDEAVKKARETMDELDKRIELLEDRIDKKWDKMDEATRKTARETLHKLHEERNKLSEWYGELKQSSSDAWGQVTHGFTQSYDVLRDSLGKAKDAYNGEAKE